MIHRILSGLASSPPAGPRLALKGLRTLSQHAKHEFVQTGLRSVLLPVMWNDSLSDCTGRELLTGEMGCVPERHDEENCTCSCPSVLWEEVRGRVST